MTLYECRACKLCINKIQVDLCNGCKKVVVVVLLPCSFFCTCTWTWQNHCLQSFMWLLVSTVSAKQVATVTWYEAPKWYEAALPSHMDGSITLTRWRQLCTPTARLLGSSRVWPPKQNLNQSSLFCRAHQCALGIQWQTDRSQKHAICVAIGKTYALDAVWPKMLQTTLTEEL